MTNTRAHYLVAHPHPPQGRMRQLGMGPEYHGEIIPGKLRNVYSDYSDSPKGNSPEGKSLVNDLTPTLIRYDRLRRPLLCARG